MMRKISICFFFTCRLGFSENVKEIVAASPPSPEKQRNGLSIIIAVDLRATKKNETLVLNLCPSNFSVLDEVHLKCLTFTFFFTCPVAPGRDTSLFTLQLVTIGIFEYNRAAFALKAPYYFFLINCCRIALVLPCHCLDHMIICCFARAWFKAQYIKRG